MVTVAGVEIFLDGERIKVNCKNSGSGYSWVGFCKYCKRTCPLSGKLMVEFEEAMGGKK